ncbi:hypothetical protein KDA82_06180 [Streptomyces daliensis]|uniref:Uncharacterized protein n=1 Tax=Streptomyces daliensis TaxID=299421 RepID=A0A8T4IS41_9ACTN|nr:hypothetical protein [Streptomyces daliensis]
MTTLRCAAAHSEDPSPCEGAHAVVRVVDQHGDEATGCVHHAARMYASLVRPRVYPSPGHGGKAIEVYKRAAALAPFAWVNAAA